MNVKEGVSAIQLTELKRCPACGNQENFKCLFRLSRFNLYQCGCGLKFINPYLSDSAMIELYNSPELLREVNPALEHYYDYDSLCPATQTFKDYSRVLDRLEKLTQGRRLIEIGCGRGAFLRVAESRGWSVLGVDSSHLNVETVQAAGIQAVCSDFLSFQCRELFDGVVLWDLIEHTDSPLSFIEKARALLKPEGLLVIATPHDPSLLTILASWLYRVSGGRIRFALEKFYIVEHVTYFNSRVLKELLAKGGFQVVDIWKTETDLERYQFHWIVKRMLRILFWIARSIGLENRVICIARKRG